MKSRFGFRNLALLSGCCVGLGWLAFASSGMSVASDTPTPVPSGATVLSQQAVAPDPALPANNPDKFAWTLFLLVNQKAKQQVPINGKPGSPMTNNAVWETWPDDPWTFPKLPDPANPPKWPAGAEVGKKLRKSPSTSAIHGRRVVKAATPAPATPPDEEGADVGKLSPGGVNAADGNGVGEEVRRNKPTFDYIIKNNLWYTQGIAAFFAKASANVNDPAQFAANSVNFPIEAIEVKGNWILITEEQKPKFHWNYNASGQLCGLVAMHISSKALPNWFWSTFEHEDNPGIGDYIGIHDSFGANPAHTPSATTALNTLYPPTQVTPQLADLFTKSGFTGEWGDAFKHYKLKGSQIDFTDSAGRPLMLGNSVTEAGFMPTASCITCHSRAAVNSSGASAFPIFGEKQALPLVNIPQQGSVTNQGSTFITYNGEPDPNWYFRFNDNQVNNPNGSTTLLGTTLLNMQADFVWAIPFKAHPVPGK